ncbi:MAG: hypothetical protein HKN37_15840 [Rhodothermales bacterium]|nr:hypothetical protein [Rhodothermales bacterium]
MWTEDYTREIVISNTASAAFRALTAEFGEWWTPISSPITKVGELVTFTFDATHWTMRVLKLVAAECVELQCIDAHHVHEGLPNSILKEWQGTVLSWSIRAENGRTRIGFVHKGLAPSLDCYEVCERGWDHYFVNCLKVYLDSSGS